MTEGLPRAILLFVKIRVKAVMSAERRVSRSLPSQPFFQSKALRFIRTKLFSSVGRYLYHVYGRVFGTQGKRDRVSFRALHTYIHRLQTKALQAIKEGSGYRVVRLFRSYSAFSIVTSSALLVSVSNFTEGKDSESLLFGYINGASAENTQGVKHRLAAQVSKKENLSLVPLANVVSTIDPEQKDDTSLFDMQSGALQSQVMLSSQAGSSIARDPEEDGGVKIYTVATGDTVSGIAAKNGITVNTILWANDLDNVDQIKPGDQIFILPVAGLSYKVEPNDTIDSIALKYKAEKDKIIAFNELPANGELTAGELIIIPDGRKEVPKPVAPDTGLERREYATSTGGTATDISGFRKLDGKAGTGHRFPYGYCTWFVAQKRYVPWSGNAGTWLYKAKAMGYKTGRAPAVGAIVVTTENRFYGHVALVEKVSGGNITVSEMNYTGWAKTSRRTLSATSKVIKGFIY
ncbi:MAG: LysM peptidoglycan-binding domain-containing protein [Candidatus Moraniibacteriota bacterium]|nr:MAG: LysM peptidoglycan-binding domain-containing protein [Candidatus Moranbacteria bacterium]